MENSTLIISLALVSAICSVALFANWYSNRLVPGLLHLAIGYAITAVGIILLTTQTSVSPIISVLIANILIMGGRIPFLFGLTAFWNQEKSQLRLFCLVWFLGTAIGLLYFTMIDESVMWRIRIYTIMMVIFSCCYVYILLQGLRIEHKLRPVMAVTTNFGAYALITLFSINALGEFVLMLVRPGIPLTDPDAGTALLLLGAIITMIVTAISVVIMTTEELSVEHKENSIYDPITTILNHRTFLEVSQRVLGVALRHSKPVSILLIEVTNLDEISKQFGVRVANELLRHFSMMATDRRRNEDVLARSTYNQFHLLLPGVDEAGAQVVITKILNAVNGEDFVYRGKKQDIKMAIAAITRREEDLHLVQMLQEIELVLFRVKREQDLQTG